MEHLGLVVIDGLNLLRRVFEANPDEDSIEKAERACTAAMSTFNRALHGADDFRPTHAIAVFDADGPNWRHELYPAYKANRKPMSAHLRAELPSFRERLASELGLYSLALPGVEADDVIGTIVERWTQKGTHRNGRVVICSTDKDLYEFVQYGVEFRDVFQRAWVTPEQIQAKVEGTPPHLIRDYLALLGDASDCIPGVPLIGKKTAASYLAEYGSLAAVLDAARDNKLKGKAGASVREHIEQAQLSRRLVALKTDITLGLTWRMLKLPA